jgi:hypothetical protein
LREFQQVFLNPGKILNPSLQTNDREDARRLGRLEAESYDLGLREREGREREERLARLALSADGSWDSGASLANGGSSSTIWRLQQENERLAAFHRAVIHSKAWRLIQALRRPFGRAW